MTSISVATHHLGTFGGLGRPYIEKWGLKAFQRPQKCSSLILQSPQPGMRQGLGRWHHPSKRGTLGYLPLCLTIATVLFIHATTYCGLFEVAANCSIFDTDPDQVLNVANDPLPWNVIVLLHLPFLHPTKLSSV